MKKIVISLAVIFPVIMSAQTIGIVMQNLTSSILRPLIGILLTVALVVFFWGMVKYISSLSSEKDKVDGKNMMIWGVVTLFVMVSVWGLVNLIKGTLNLDNSVPDSIVLPGTSQSNSSN